MYSWNICYKERSGFLLNFVNIMSFFPNSFVVWWQECGYWIRSPALMVAPVKITSSYLQGSTWHTDGWKWPGKGDYDPIASVPCHPIGRSGWKFGLWLQPGSALPLHTVMEWTRIWRNTCSLFFSMCCSEFKINKSWKGKTDIIFIRKYNFPSIKWMMISLLSKTENDTSSYLAIMNTWIYSGYETSEASTITSTAQQCVSAQNKCIYGAKSRNV